MSLKSLSLLVSGTSLVLAAAFVFFSLSFIHSYILALLPADIGLSLSRGVYEVLIYQAIALMALAFILTGLSYWINTRLIYRPLRAIIGSMETFIKEGTLAPLPKLSAATSEVRTLGTVFEDFTKRVEASHAHDVEISRVKSDFISTAAHQLRTPLTGIRWALEALEHEPLTEEQEALVKSAVDKSHDLVAIVGTLLDISSIESGKYQYKYGPVNLQELVADVTNDFALLAKKRGVTLSYEIAGEVHGMVRADKERVKWVLNNLIENAIRYTPSGGTVRVSVAQAPGRLQVFVHDTGIGIQPQDRGNIFERFYRAGNAIAKENGGNGLGLYIARTIATDHGGDLNFRPNEEGVGTTFTLSLPLAR